VAAGRTPSPPPPGWPGEPGIFAGAGPPFAPANPELHWLFELNRFGIRPGLERIEQLLSALGHPERSLRTIAVAGTNGKGSTTRLLAALVGAAGHRVGCYTSPHLLRVEERLEIDGRACAPAVFAAAASRLRPTIERLGASWFESLTAIALDLCREAAVEVLCCEAGLGGRLDATNALPAVATLLTSVALDHQEILGATLPEIAAEKLGLLKAGAPLFCAVQAGLRPQVFAAAVAAGCPAHFLDEQVEITDRGGSWDLRLRRGVLADLPDLPTPWLRRNAALALLCVEELAAAGTVNRPASYGEALAGAFLPGRFQRLLSGPDWILDTAHNDEALGATLTDFLARPCRGRRQVLFGSVREKRLGPEVGALLRRCDRVVAAPVGLPRSRTPEELRALLGGWEVGGRVGPEVAADCGSAIGRLAEATPEDAVLVTGSGFLVAEVLHRLGFRDLAETRRVSPAGVALARAGVPPGAGG
jgi:dihydrofolate synthase/folylpolyglutamate synthase